MTGLYVICSRRRQEHLSRRRNGYLEFDLGDGFGYARAAQSPDDLGILQDGQVRMLPRWVEDVRSVADDPAASFFVIDMQNREAAFDAICRGRLLPLVDRPGHLVIANTERRAASGV